MELEQQTPATRVVVAGYDDLLDTLTCRGPRLDPAVWDDLVDRLAAHDVTHLAGGSADMGIPSPYHGPQDVDLERLIRDLARAPEPRLRDALVALLLRHPEDASAVRSVLTSLAPHDPARASLTARLLAAAALQRRHHAAFAQVLPPYTLIDVADLVAAYGLPVPDEEKGHALLRTTKELVAARYHVVDYVDGWEDVARHTLREARGVGEFTRIGGLL